MTRLLMTLFGFLVLENYSLADTSLETLLKLRKEVELLSLEVSTTQKTVQAKIDVFIEEDQNLEAKIFSEQTKIDQITAAEKELLLKKESKLELQGLDKTRQWCFEFIGKYRNDLQLTLPSYRSALEEKLNKIDYELKHHRINEDQALISLWFVLEHDLRKSQEIGFELVQIPYQGKIISAEMARLGRSIGFIRTMEGKYGVLNTTKPAGFNSHLDSALTISQDQNSIRSIEVLISQVKKNEGYGIFKLPLMRPQI